MNKSFGDRLLGKEDASAGSVLLGRGMTVSVRSPPKAKSSLYNFRDCEIRVSQSRQGSSSVYAGRANFCRSATASTVDPGGPSLWQAPVKHQTLACLTQSFSGARRVQGEFEWVDHPPAVGPRTAETECRSNCTPPTANKQTL